MDGPLMLRTQLHDLRGRVLDAVSAFGRALLLLLIVFRFARFTSAQSEKQKKGSTGAITAGEKPE
jgi:hypothetical protein